MAEIDAQLLQCFSDGMPFGACLVDLQGKIIYWNSAAEGITGYLGHEVLGRAYRGDLLIQSCGAVSAAAGALCPVLEVFRDGTSVGADLFLRHKQGHRIALRVFAFALRNAMGEMQGVGEIFDPSHTKQESPAWGGHSDHEFELATGLPAVEESREQLKTLLHSCSASTAVLLIEMTEQPAILQHGGASMLHQAIRVLARTIAGLLPSRHYVGCWSEGRLIAMIPECAPETLEEVRITLAAVGSSCAVKWWGDRVTVGMRAVARYVDPAQSADTLIQSLEQELKNAAAGGD